MTTTDDELVEQLARAMAAKAHVEGEKAWTGYKVYARAVLPIVRAEVRNAQAEALRDAAEHYGPAQISGLFFGPDGYTKTWLSRRADTIEKEADQ